MISVQLYRKMKKLPQELREVMLDLVEELAKTVTKKDFKELKDTVAELIESHRAAEQRLTRLEQAVT